MSSTGLKTFDSTLQTTNIWLDELMSELHWDDRQKAYQALRAVLQTLRDRLTVNEASDFAAQLPLLVRGIYYEGWHPADKPLKERSLDQFLAHVDERFAGEPSDPARLTQAVFKVLKNHATEGVLEHVKSSLPSDVQKLLAV